MKKIFIFLFSSLFIYNSYSQSDNCSGAIALTIGSCVTGNPGATQNLAGCSTADANDDAWYKFTAAANGSYSISVKGSATYDAVFQVYSGSCGSLTSIAGCVDSYISGGTESVSLSGLAAGVYYLRIYDYGSSATPGTFTTCITLPPTAPGNNDCTGAKVLTAGATCINTSTTSFAATQSTNVATNCNGGTPDDDVWFMFTATNYTQSIQVTPTGSALMDPVIELFSGTCATLSVIACQDGTNLGAVENMIAVGLTPGTNYYVRVYDWYADGGYPFDICVSGTSIIAGSQPNDEPCSAIHLPTVTADCNYLDFSTVGATKTSTLLATAPSTCTNWQGSAFTGTAAPYYGAPTTGGYGASTADVWFSITVPASGQLFVMPRPNMGAGWIQDGVMVLYRGASCSALTQYTCTDDHDYPGGYNDFQPFVEAYGLTPGEVVYLRYFAYGSTPTGSFGLCVTAPTNDLCSKALYICDINGYSASTSEAYKPDHPCNMLGNGEAVVTTTAGTVYNYSVGANPSAPFGLGGTWGAGSATQNVYIDNNSWIRFTAASPTVSLRVTVYDCWGTAPNTQTATVGSAKGVQMQIFSTTSGCCGFTPVSDFKEGTGTYTVNANSLIVGNDYYLMVDGWAGDICKYDIQAISGVALPDIIATPPTVCPGKSSILTAPAGATSYTWQPGGANTQTISVTPSTIETYTCFVGGVCGNKQTLTKTVYLYLTPTVSINAGAAISTCGTQTLTLTGSGANTYSWSTGNTTTSFTTAPTVSISYSVIGTSINGCTNTAVSNVTVNTVPTIVPTGSNTICNGGNTSLTVSGANTYTWSPSATLSASTGTAVTATPTTGTNYTVTATAANGCTNTATYSVTVNPKPNVSSTTTGSVICSNNSTTLNGTGASTYTWTGGVSDGVAFTPTATATYTVIGTIAATGCTNSAVRTITVNTTPTVTANPSNSVVCNGFPVTLSGGGASTYTWTGGVTNGVAFNPASSGSYTVTGTSSGCTNTAVSSVTVNSLPTVSSTASTNTICNGSSVTLTGTGANTYTWTGGVSNGVAFSPSSTATYTVTGTDGNGCVNTSVKTITVNSIPTSTASTTGTITCATNTVNLNSTATAGASYTWTAPGGSSISSGTNSQNAVGQGLGTYTLNVMSTAGCPYSTTITANVNTTVPTASATNGTLTCAQTSTVLVGGPTSGVTYSWSGPGILGSNTTANITATVVGNYSLVTTSTLTGCSSTVSAIGTVTNNLTTPTVTAGSNQVITCAAPSVTLTGSATAGSSLSWSSGSTTNTTTVGGAGIYTLTAMNPGTGCTATSTVQVSPSAGTPNGTVSAASNSITCSLSSASISITSTISPLTYSWTGPGTIASPTSSATTVSSGGTYTVTITNTASCSQSYPVVVPTNTTPVTATASLTPASSSITCITTSLTLSSTPTGTNYAYAWTGPNIISGGTTANPIVGAGGNYTVTITNSINGCSGASGTTTVPVPTNTTAPTLSLSATSVTTTCGNPSATVTVTSNSNPNTTYTWTAPATGTISSTSVSNPTIGGSGVFTVAITNTVTGCPSAPATVSVTADANIPTFTLSTNATTVNCTTPTPTVTISTSPSGLTYSWSPTPNSGVTTASPTFTASGNYTCVVTNTVNGCSTNVPMVAVSLNTTAPTATATPASSITCSSSSIAISSTVTPSSNVNYTWSGPNVISGNTSLTPIIGLGGNYVIAMTNTVNGCSGSYTVIVPTNTTAPSMSLSTNAFTTTCAAPSVIISASSNADPSTTYSWTAPATGTISSTTVSNPSVGGSGVFTVTATNTINGCISAIGTVSITADANIPTFVLSSGTVTITCSMPSPSVSLTSTVSNVSYSWNPTPSSGATTASPTFTAVGNYTCVITNPVNNCSTNLPLVIVGTNTSVPSVSVTSISSITCNNSTATVTAVSNPSSSTYTWSGTGIIGSANNSSITVNTDGTYSLSVTDPVNGCVNNTVTATVITNTTAPTLTVASTSSVITCSISNSTLTATSSLTVTWLLPTGGSASNPVIANTAGDYTATVTDGVNGCITQTVLTIGSNIIPPNANAGAAAVMPCNLSITTLTSTSTSTDAVSYSWSGPNATSITSGSNSATPTVTDTGVYTLTVTNLVTGCMQTATVNVSEDNVIAAFSADPTTGEAPLTVNFTDESIGSITSWSWTFGNGDVSTNQNPSSAFTSEGTYTVFLIANSNLCSDTVSHTIVVEGGFVIEVPNVFTPNGDGANDAFHVKISGVKSAQGSIYNRWGQLLYSWDVLNASWDGKASNGENCPDATYFYIIKVIDKKDKEHQAPGYVLITR